MATATPDIEQNLDLAPPAAKWKRSAVSLAALAIVAAAAPLAWRKYEAATAEPPVRYQTEPVRVGNLTTTVIATGQLQPTNEVEVGSEVSGIVDSVDADYNDHVKAGQVLLRINTDKFKAQVLQSQAALDAAKAKVNDAKVTLQETEKKYRRIVEARERSRNQTPSQQDLEAAEANYSRAKVAVETTQAAVTQAEGTLTVDQTNLAKTVIRSPIDGVVLSRAVEPGQTIAASFSVTTLFKLAESLTKMKLEVNIDEADVGQVKAGQSVTFTVDAYPGRRFPGKITQLRYQSTTTNNVVTYLAVISVDNPQLLLRPGMTATAEITVNALKNVLLVPNVALRYEPASAAPAAKDNRSWFRKLTPGPPPRNTATASAATEATPAGSHVWVLNAGEAQPVSVAVVTGATNGKLTEIRSGSVAAGVPVVVDSVRAGK